MSTSTAATADYTDPAASVARRLVLAALASQGLRLPELKRRVARRWELIPEHLIDSVVRSGVEQGTLVVQAGFVRISHPSPPPNKSGCGQDP
jgi:hypothetical protein